MRSFYIRLRTIYESLTRSYSRAAMISENAHYLFAYGTLRSSHKEHRQFCPMALSARPARVLGRVSSRAEIHLSTYRHSRIDRRRDRVSCVGLRRIPSPGKFEPPRVQLLGELDLLAENRRFPRIRYPSARARFFSRLRRKAARFYQSSIFAKPICPCDTSALATLRPFKLQGCNLKG